MVLGFGSRSTKKKGKGGEERVVRMSPSLPEMSTQGIPWPSDLVDVAAIRQSPPPDRPTQGATKTSFSSPDRSAIPFHKPFRVSPSKSANTRENGGPNGPIASLYMSHPPSAYGTRPSERASTSHSNRTRHSHRRHRIAPTFNLMARICSFYEEVFAYIAFRLLVHKAQGRFVKFIIQPTDALGLRYCRARFCDCSLIPQISPRLHPSTSARLWTVSCATVVNERTI